MKGFTSLTDLEAFLRQYSRSYSDCLGIDKIAAGGEAIVYRIIHTGVDEVVAKCPVFGDNPSIEQLNSGYDSIFYESQTLKLNPLKSNIC